MKFKFDLEFEKLMKENAKHPDPFVKTVGPINPYFVSKMDLPIQPKLMLHGPHSPIICSVKHSDYLRSRYPAREIDSTIYCPADQFYYFSKTGRVRMVDIEDFSIWVCDLEKGFPYMKRVR